MCGIHGILRLAESAPTIDLGELDRTSAALARRGPDGAGRWQDATGRVALGHRRLAILDPSPAGAQPMASADGRFQLVLNGEIYNFRALRAELAAAGERFRSESDTEVLLALYARHGPAMLRRLRGMYALALWDSRDESLFLARDPYGIKPLYYSHHGGLLRFTSQVKALVAGGGLPLDVDPAGLGGFLLWGAVPEPHTIRRAIRALPAGSYLLARGGRVEEPVRFYQFGSLAPPAGERPGEPDLEGLFGATVEAHLVSDVPVAIFLSAGIDSSLLAALACRALPAPPRTFTLRFDELLGTPRDEGPLAAAVARRLGTHHRERRVGREVLAGLWQEAIAAMDQPSIDGFNTFLVSRLAHEEGLKVVLSGLGGDELLGSYPSFRDVPRLRTAARWLTALPGARRLWPRLARGVAARRPKLAALAALGGSLGGAYFLRRGLFLPGELPGLLGGERAAEALAAYDPVAAAEATLAELASPSPWLAVHQLESSLYMRHQLLRDADWASMAHSLELRVPLVDPWLRDALAVDGFATVRRLGKAEIARRLAPELPAEVFTRPKSGFYVPLAEWMADARQVSPGGLGSRRLALAVLAAQGIPLAAEATAP